MQYKAYYIPDARPNAGQVQTTLAEANRSKVVIKVAKDG